MTSGMIAYAPMFHSYVADCLCGWEIYCDTKDQAMNLLESHEEGCDE